ncbi:MAG: OB-fold domain-containing protein [Betaproteobacteria bacterium]|nr:OB-fold domain-containing protein [Betaproteobacteria bacterium]
MGEVHLSDRGTVFTFSLIGRKSRFSIIEPPYFQAEVELPEGIHVLTMLDQCAPESVRIGMPVEVYVDKVREHKDGNDVIAFKFKPVA